LRGIHHALLLAQNINNCIQKVPLIFSIILLASKSLGGWTNQNLNFLRAVDFSPLDWPLKKCAQAIV
jgi:hypothetical protein